MMKEQQGSTREPLSNLAYDWVTIIQNKSEAIRAYQKYIQDAQQANSPECVQLMQRICDEDARHVQDATQHLMQVLGGEMGQGQTSQGQMGGQSQRGGMGGQSGGQAGSGQQGRRQA